MLVFRSKRPPVFNKQSRFSITFRGTLFLVDEFPTVNEVSGTESTKILYGDREKAVLRCVCDFLRIIDGGEKEKGLSSGLRGTIMGFQGGEEKRLSTGH